LKSSRLLAGTLALILIAGLGTPAYSQLFSPAQVNVNTDLDLVTLGDESGSITDPDYILYINGVVAGFQALFDAIPQLFGNVRLSYIGFGDIAIIRCGPDDINDQPALTAHLDCISALNDDPQNLVKLNGKTAWNLALDEAQVVFDAPSDLVDDPEDEQVIDIITDGKPNTPESTPAESQAAAIASRDSLIANGDLVKLAGLAVGVSLVGNLQELGWPNPPVDVFPAPVVADDLPEEDGFVIVIDDFEDFAAAFEVKLLGDICDLVPDDPNCIVDTFCDIFPDDPQCKIGGEFLPIDTTALLLAGLQSSAIWMLPVVLSGIGIGLFVASRKSENS